MKLKETYTKSVENIELTYQRNVKEHSERIDALVEDNINLAHERGFSPLSITEFSSKEFDAALTLFSDPEFADQKNKIVEYIFPPQMLKVGTLTPTNQKTSSSLSIPALVPFARNKDLAFIVTEANRTKIHELMQVLAVRFALSLPLNLIKIYQIDGYSYGRSFSRLNKLNNKYKAGEVITAASEITRIFAEFEEWITEANRKYLTVHEWLDDYNKTAGPMAQPYRFVFVSNFPYGFNEESMNRLYTMLNNHNGSRAGIFFILSVDIEAQINFKWDITRLKNLTTNISQNSEIDFEIENSIFDKTFNDSFNILLDVGFPSNLERVFDMLKEKADNIKPPSTSLSGEIFKKLNDQELWHESAIAGIEIPIGFVDPTVKQKLIFSKGTNSYFGLIGGIPGMGKTVLLHDIIIMGSVLYSPQELQFYLIDCKNGTGFNIYKNLPHTKVLAISNDREFGASALGSLVQEKNRREKLFADYTNKTGNAVGKYEDYRNVSGEALPRILVIIDEFQVLLEIEDRVTNGIRNDFNKIFREARAAGIHIILCTQTLRNVDLDISNVSWRLSFKLLSETESERVIGNEEAITLTQKGSAILNTDGGTKKRNEKFQISYLTESDALKAVNMLSEYSKKLNAAPDIDKYISDGKIHASVQKNDKLLESILNDTFIVNHRYVDTFIGEPSFIRKEHVFIRFQKQSKSNLAIIGTDFKSAKSILGMVIYQIFKQSGSTCQAHIIDNFAPDHENYGSLKVITEFDDRVKMHSVQQVDELFLELSNELEARVTSAQTEGANKYDRIVLCLIEPSKNRSLREESSSVSSMNLLRLIKEGPDFGIHTLVYCLNDKSFGEVFGKYEGINSFEHRIALYHSNYDHWFTESISTILRQNGTGLFESIPECVTFNPDLFNVYSELELSDDTSKNKEIKIIQKLLK